MLVGVDLDILSPELLDRLVQLTEAILGPTQLSSYWTGTETAALLSHCGCPSQNDDRQHPAA
jgi:hypothetical protein